MPLERSARCNVTGRYPSGGKSYNVLAEVRPAGRLSAVRAVTPRPPNSAAHRPSKLGLLAAIRYGIFAAARRSNARLRKAHRGPSTASGKGCLRGGVKV